MPRFYLLNYIRQTRVYTLVLAARLIRELGWQKGDNIVEYIEGNKLVLQRVEQPAEVKP